LFHNSKLLTPFIYEVKQEIFSIQAATPKKIEDLGIFNIMIMLVFLKKADYEIFEEIY